MMVDASGNPIVTTGALEEYYEAFRLLCSDLPEAWHLLSEAEDRCRSEQFARLRRQAEADHVRSAVPGFDPKMPWDYTFRAAAKDKPYWEKHVRDPALIFLARGGRGQGTRKTDVLPGDVEPTRLSKKARRMHAKTDQIKSLQEQVAVMKSSQQARSSNSDTNGSAKTASKGQHPSHAKMQ